jgi:glycosyltransferase involved in cell wall biosynthesis
MNLVSVIITTYNRVDLLERALKSAKEQVYQNIEIIISDNASTDSTEEKSLEWAKEDSRIKYFRNSENIGAANNHRRALLDYAKGDWALFISDDDYLTDKYFISNGIEQILKTGTEIAFYQTGVSVLIVDKSEITHVSPKIKDEIEVFGPTAYFLEYFNILFFSFTTTILNRNQIIEEKLIEKRFRLDVELLLVMSLSKVSILSKEVCGVYTIHTNQNYASSNFINYISILDCYIKAAEYASKYNFLSSKEIKKWIKISRHYFYLNIVGWVNNLLNIPQKSPFIVITNKWLNILIEDKFFVKQVYYLWLFKDYDNSDNKKYHQIYIKGIWYQIIWYLYSHFNLYKLFLKLK